jgi:GxxExxY protein
MISKIKLLYENETFRLNGISFKVQNELGRFAREKQYCDLYEKYLNEEGIQNQRELTVAGTGNRLDFLVFGHVPLEMKARPFLTKEDYYQMQRYLQTLNEDLGIIYNFRNQYMKPKRILRETRKHPQVSVNPDAIRKSGLQ